MDPSAEVAKPRWLTARFANRIERLSTLKHWPPEALQLEWWPSHVRKAFSHLGEVLGHAQLHPDVLSRVRRDGLQGHEIIFSHHKDDGARKGQYRLEIIGPLYAGTWPFQSGFLEKMARAAAAVSHAWSGAGAAIAAT